MLSWFATKNVVFPVAHLAHICGLGEGPEGKNESEPYVFCVTWPFSASARRTFCVAVLGTAPLRFAETSTAPYGRFI